MASGDGATSVRILNENVDKLTKLPDMVKAFDELTTEEVGLIARILLFSPRFVHVPQIVSSVKLCFLKVAIY